jgi:hypothetical protein
LFKRQRFFDTRELGFDLAQKVDATISLVRGR